MGIIFQEILQVIKVLNLQQMIFVYLFVYLFVFKRTFAEEGLRPQINVILIAQILALGIKTSRPTFYTKQK